MRIIIEQRILALDVHPRSIGFVVFENSRVILDWGVKSFRNGENEVRVPLRPKLAQLIKTYKPDALVVRTPRTSSVEEIVEKIRSEANLQDVAFRMIHPHVLVRVFSEQKNKDQIALAIVARYPELSSVLPPRRRVWQSEDYRMSIFDAAAIGMGYFERKTRRRTLSLD